MKSTTITLVKLEASDGMMLTDGESYGKVVYLGKNDTPDNWNEISESKYQKILQKQEEESQREIERVDKV